MDAEDVTVDFMVLDPVEVALLVAEADAVVLAEELPVDVTVLDAEEDTVVMMQSLNTPSSTLVSTLFTIVAVESQRSASSYTRNPFSPRHEIFV